MKKFGRGPWGLGCEPGKSLSVRSCDSQCGLWQARYSALAFGQENTPTTISKKPQEKKSEDVAKPLSLESRGYNFLDSIVSMRFYFLMFFLVDW